MTAGSNAPAVVREVPLKRFLTRTAQEGQSLWSRLPAVQKVTVVGVTVIVIVTLAWFAVGARQIEYKLLAPHEQIAELPGPFGSVLTQNDLQWRRARDADGNDIVEVAAADLPAALELLGDPSATAEDANSTSSPWKGILGQRFLEWDDGHRKRQSLRQSIRTFDAVQDVTTLEVVPPSTRRGHPGGGGSASVHLRLKPGVTRIPLSAARCIREMIVGAYQLAPETISITDSKGHPYPAASGDAARLEREEYYRDQFRSEISAHLRRIFATQEFGCLVDVSVDIPSGGGTGVPSGRFVVTHVGVVLTFDKAAVEHHFASTGSTDGVERFKAFTSGYLNKYLARFPHKVDIQLRPSADPVPVAASAPDVEAVRKSGIAELVRQIASSSRETWLVVGTAFALIFAIFAIGILRRRVAAKARTSSAPRTVGTTDENRQNSDAESTEQENEVVPDPLLHMAEQTSGWVRERPQAAVSILKVWLTADGSGGREAKEW